jgi:hypothetical protein
MLTAMAQLAGEDSATLVRSEDRHSHFMSEPQPGRDLDREFVALHRVITECGARILYRGADLASLQRAQGAGATRLNRPGAAWAPNTEVALIIGLCYFVER